MITQRFFFELLFLCAVCGIPQVQSGQVFAARDWQSSKGDGRGRGRILQARPHHFLPGEGKSVVVCIFRVVTS